VQVGPAAFAAGVFELAGGVEAAGFAFGHGCRTGDRVLEFGGCLWERGAEEMGDGIELTVLYCGLCGVWINKATRLMSSWITVDFDIDIEIPASWLN
jgi:hypothetical protein